MSLYLGYKIASLINILYYNINNKKVMLVGENHICELCKPNNKTIYFTDYLVKILKNKNIVVNYLIEGNSNNKLYYYSNFDYSSLTNAIYSVKSKSYKNISSKIFDTRDFLHNYIYYRILDKSNRWNNIYDNILDIVNTYLVKEIINSKDDIIFILKLFKFYLLIQKYDTPEFLINNKYTNPKYKSYNVKIKKYLIDMHQYLNNEYITLFNIKKDYIYHQDDNDIYGNNIYYSYKNGPLQSYNKLLDMQRYERHQKDIAKILLFIRSSPRWIFIYDYDLLYNIFSPFLKEHIIFIGGNAQVKKLQLFLERNNIINKSISIERKFSNTCSCITINNLFINLISSFLYG